MDDIEQRLRLGPEELRDWWLGLTTEERYATLPDLGRDDAEELFFVLTARDQAELVLRIPAADRRSWVRLLSPAEVADLVQAAPDEERAGLLALLDDTGRHSVAALLAYAEDDAGGLMDPRFARVRPDMMVDEAITYLRRQAREHPHSVHYVYAIDAKQTLCGVVSYRELIEAPAGKHVRDVMKTDLVTAHEQMDQEALSRLFAEHDLGAIPVVDDEGRMKGVVTVHDIVDVVQEEATEDMQKMGGTEALDAPYPAVTVGQMIRKRGVWLSTLLVGEMLTANALGWYQGALRRAVVLALFIPLIISSGGNSGSQATTLVIRAMGLGEIRLKDWWRVARREVATGFGLGCILGTIVFIRVVAWQALMHPYGAHWLLLAVTVGGSLVGVVVWGTLAGSMLPFVLRRLGFDPAAASAPFVATLVDVTGLIIYFSLAGLILRGTLL
jgi:magnesium transporter